MGHPARRTIRFGTYEADPAAGELRKSGERVSVQEQPFRLLILLLEHPGEVVTRDELRQKLWGETHVDFEEGLNTAVRKLRDALGDSASNPRFIETLPRRGYRFIAPAEVAGVAEPDPVAVEPGRRRSAPWFAIAGSVAFLVVAGLLVRAWITREKPVLTASPPTQLTRDSGLTTDPVISRDGKLLAYASDRGDADNLDIWVQHINGGEAHRVAGHPADDHQPDFSPDGSEVIFRSERDGGGIYSVSTLGGNPRLIVRNAYVPRFSPDGSQIAYAVGAFGSGGFTGRLHLYTPATGSTMRLAGDLKVAGPATWTPDGKSVVFAASKRDLGPLLLWISPVEGGPATPLDARPIVEDETMFGHVRTVSVALFGGQVIVSVKQGDSSNLWAAPVALETSRLTGELRRITLGSGNEVLPSISAAGKLVFANHTYSTNIWEANPAATRGMRRITHDRARNHRPSVSADGSKMAYISDRTGNTEVWVKDLASGSDLAVTRTPKPEIFVAISRDASSVAFWDGSGVYMVPAGGGAPRLLCDRCGRPDDWSPDGKLILWLQNQAPTPIGSLDPATGIMTNLVSHPALGSIAPDLSPDGNWLTFHTLDKFTRQVFIAPNIGRLTPPSSWIAVTDGKALDREAKWSADGNGIYFLSDRDGFRCIWGRKLDPKTKQPLGSIHPVLHMHDARLSLLYVPNTGNVSVCPVGDKLIFAVGELSGNLWMTELRP